jgi:hypothetical protein
LKYVSTEEKSEIENAATQQIMGLYLQELAKHYSEIRQQLKNCLMLRRKQAQRRYTTEPIYIFPTSPTHQSTNTPFNKPPGDTSTVSLI